MYYFAPSMESSPYYWRRVPWLYVKWGKPDTYPSRRRYGKFGSWFKLPDREVIICHESERPRQVDEALDLNPFTSPLYDEARYFLLGQGSGRRAAPHHKWHRPGLEILVDSGGAQLRTGSNWVDPQASLDFMNLTGDIGVVLDMPLRRADSSSMRALERLAKSQRIVSNWMLKAKRSDLKLLNVTHGNNFEQFWRWKEIVEDDRIDGWAINKAWHLGMLIGQGVTSHIHCLGFGALYPSVAWAGRHIDVVTSDSSTWSMTFRNSNVPFQDASSGVFDYSMFGGSKRWVNHQFHFKGKLACSCPVCSRVGWFYPFTDARGQDLRFLVAGHVLLTQFYQADALNRMAQESRNVEEYVTNVVEWLGGTSPDSQSRAQLRDKDGSWNPRWCAFCGKEADNGRGEFPTCRSHARLSNYVAEIYMMEDCIDNTTELQDAVRHSKKTAGFGLKRLFGKQEKMFVVNRGKHLSAMEARAGESSGLPIAKRYRAWVKKREETCECFNPDVVLEGTGRNPINPTTPPYTAKCKRCGKSYPLPHKTKRSRKACYQIYIGERKAGDPAFTLREALKRINAKWVGFVEHGGHVAHLTIINQHARKGPQTFRLKINRKGKITTTRTRRANGKKNTPCNKSRRARTPEMALGAEETTKRSTGKRNTRIRSGY